MVRRKWERGAVLERGGRGELKCGEQRRPRGKGGVYNLPHLVGVGEEVVIIHAEHKVLCSTERGGGEGGGG